MSKVIIARFEATSVEEHNHSEGKYCEQVTMRPVYSSDPTSPNYSFSQATPCGDFNMTITNPDAFGAFVRGKEYDITIREHTKED